MSQLSEAVGDPVTDTPAMIRDLMHRTAATYPNKRAVVSMQQSATLFSGDSKTDHQGEYLTWTYAQLNQRADKLASSLSARGIRPGMRLAVFLHTSAEFMLLFWASVKLGTTFVPLDERAIPREGEVRHYLDTVKPSALFVSTAADAHLLLENSSSALESIMLKAVAEQPKTALEGWGHLISLLTEETSVDGTQHKLEDSHTLGSDLNTSSHMNGTDGQIRRQPQSDLSSLFVILFTSGSSGLPKACPITNKNAWARTVARGERAMAIEHTSLVVTGVPLSHSLGLHVLLHTWISGATLVIPAPVFDAQITLDAIESLGCTFITAVPTMLLSLLKQPNYHPSKTRSLKTMQLAGTIVSPSIVAAATDPMLIGASEVRVGYGMTEGLPVCQTSSKEGLKFTHGAVSIGQPLPGVKVRICESQTRRVLPRGETGELHFAGDYVIDGYLGSDDNSFYDDPSGHWIASGDEAMMDEEDNVFIFGRYKDVIIRGGENISPALIENCMGRAGVLGQVIGVPDDIAGEVPLAIVQVADTAEIPTADINKLVMESLGPTCLPTVYMTLAELGLTSFPLTASGKVRKSELKTVVREYLSRRASREESSMVNGISTNPVNNTESLLTNLVVGLIGISEESLQRDQPLSTILDSISMLRLHTGIQKATSKKLPLDAFLNEATITTLAMQLNAAPTDSLPVQIDRRQGPPTATDMVHTHGDTMCASRTQAQVEMLLSKYDMMWEDVQDVFPIPDLYSRRFDAMRPMSFAVRFRYQTECASPSVVRSALEKTLEKWSLLRSLALKFDNTALFVIVRACKAMYQNIISELPAVGSLEDMRNLVFPNFEDNNVSLSRGCPLVRFAITRVESTGATGLMMLANHSTWDAISIQAFARDLQANFQDEDHTHSEPFTDYKLFADTLYLHSSSVPAQLSVAYHVNRLRGIGSFREKLWPPQRCPGWFVGDDTGHTIPPTQSSSLLPERSQIDGDSGSAGTAGINRLADLDDLATVLSRHNVSAPVVFKAACAVLNARLTGERAVHFINSQAGRSWPFLDESIAKFLPNPVTIGGCTLNHVVNLVHVDPDATVGSFLTSLEEEQTLLTKHAHAPLSAIAAQLNPADAQTMYSAGRQLFNWNPAVGSGQSNLFTKDKSKLDLVGFEAFSEVMLGWHCGMNGSTAVLKTKWDGAQFGKSTVEGWADGFMAALKWLAREENWEKRIGEVESLIEV